MVLVILGLIAAAVGVAAGGGSLAGKQHRAMVELAGQVGLARAEAMKLTSDRSAVISTEGRDLSVSVGERTHTWREVDLTIAGRGRTVAETMRAELASVDVDFDSLGRTRDRVIVFDGRTRGGRMWALEFDPISGGVEVEEVGGQ